MSWTAVSRAGVPIRLTDERWAHIVEEHDDLDGRRLDVLAAIEGADLVVAGNDGERLALRFQTDGRALVAVYRERSAVDGFVVTAFNASRHDRYRRRVILWPTST